MVRRFVTVSVLVVAACYCVARTGKTPSELPLIVLDEDNMNYVPHGQNTDACIRVENDGRFHLVLRQQKYPEKVVTVHLYESTLDALRLQQLRNLVDSTAIRNLPNFTMPPLPMGTITFAMVGAHIPDRSGFREVGYVAWDEKKLRENVSPASAPEVTKEKWRASRASLLPVLQWLHEIEGMNWPEVPLSESSPCRWESSDE